MGFFSWLTNDTGVSVSNVHSSRGARPIVMVDNKGNKWYEENYDGYGVFGGKDFYELLAEMNGKSGREEGITLDFKKDQQGIIYPNLIEAENADHWVWEDEKPRHCEYQGYFY